MSQQQDNEGDAVGTIEQLIYYQQVIPSNPIAGSGRKSQFTSTL
jgi:hypothetical protein